ncbi:MAG: hypothetical protein ABI663_19335 [Chryseolinea sp.]
MEKAFDQNPINRKKSGVKRYHIFQPADDDNFVIIDLEFKNLNEAKATQTALQNMWGKIEGSLIFNPKVLILKEIESSEV